MSPKKHTTPTPVLASPVEWKTPTGSLPAVRITGLLHAIYVGPDDLPRLKDAVDTAMARLDAQQAQEVGS